MDWRNHFYFVINDPKSRNYAFAAELYRREGKFNEALRLVLKAHNSTNLAYYRALLNVYEASILLDQGKKEKALRILRTAENDGMRWFNRKLYDYGCVATFAAAFLSTYELCGCQEEAARWTQMLQEAEVDAKSLIAD